MGPSQDGGGELTQGETIRALSSDVRNGLMAKLCYQNDLTLQVMALEWENASNAVMDH